MRIRFLIAMIAISTSRAASLSPGETLSINFSAVPNTSDILTLFSNAPLTLTGTPVITTDLFNGTSLLGSIAAPPLQLGVSHYYETFFQSASSVFVPLPGTFTVADLTAMQDGTIDGALNVTVAGGSIAGFDLSFMLGDPNGLVLYDAVSNTHNLYTPKHDLTVESFSISSTPEPRPRVLIAIGLCTMAFIARWLSEHQKTKLISR